MGLMNKLGKKKPTGRNYAKEYANYDGRPLVKKKRAQRNKARRALMRQGKVHKGDGMDVDHIDSNPFDNKPKNWRVISASKNRSYPRTKTAKEKPQPGKYTKD